MDLFQSLTPAKIALRIEFPLKSWRGNCHIVVRRMLAKRLVDGVEASGNASFAPEANFHYWIKKTNDTVVDPTRWVYEDGLASIYVGPNGPEYHEQPVIPSPSALERIRQRRVVG